VLARVQIEHEVDQRAPEAGAGAHQHGEACAGHARGAFEIKNAERFAQFPVRFRREVEHARRAPHAHFGILGRALPHRHAFVRQIRERQQERVALRLHRVQRRVEFLDLRGARLVLSENRSRIATFLLRLRHLLARRVLIALEVLDRPNQMKPLGVFGLQVR